MFSVQSLAHCIALCRLLYSILLCCAGSTLLYSTLLYSILLCFSVLFCVVFYVLCCVVLCCFYQLYVVIVYYNAPCHFIIQKVSTLLTRHGLISAALTLTLATNDEEHEETNGLSIFYHIYSTMFVFFQLFSISSRNQGSILYCSFCCRCNGKRKTICSVSLA